MMKLINIFNINKHKQNQLNYRKISIKDYIKDEDMSSSSSLSGLLQTKLGSITDNNQTLEDIYIKNNQKGIMVRMAFDNEDMTTVPGTYLHNAMYTPNPVYIISNHFSIYSTTVLIANHSDNKFNQLLPGNSNFDKNAYTFNNNAFYAHDSNSTDLRFNQYALKTDNTILNSASEKNCNFGRKFSGIPETISCNNIDTINNCCIGSIEDCKNNIAGSFLPSENCITGNVSNGKGIHWSWDMSQFNPFNIHTQLYGVQYTINDENTTKKDNTLGKWSPEMLLQQEEDIKWTDIETFEDNLKKSIVIDFSKDFDTPGSIAYWVQHGYQNKDILSVFDYIPHNSDSESYSSKYFASPTPIHIKTDFIIPWTDNLFTMIHMNNALFEYYFNRKDLIDDEYLDFWWGWNEIPVISNEPDMSVWSNGLTNNLNDYTLIIYVQDGTFALELDNPNLIKTKTLCYEAWFEENGADENLNIIYSSEYNTNLLTNFQKCFLNDDDNITPNSHWINITSLILKYVDNLLNNTSYFGSCSIVFMRQKLVKLGDSNIYQKQLFDVDPKSVKNELNIGFIKHNNEDLEIKFIWENINNINQYIFKL